MTEMRVIVPSEMEEWLKLRLAEGGYPDVGEYLLDLIRRDHDEHAAEAGEESSEYIAWVRERVSEGLASGVCKQDAFAVLDEIRTQREARRG